MIHRSLPHVRAFKILAQLIDKRASVRHQVLVVAPDAFPQDIDMCAFSAHEIET